jgi:cysteinyl-tRNA synthetase
MSKQMKVIMENWRSNLLLEQEALSIHEELLEQFTNEIKIIRESSNDLNEVLSKVADFAKRAYNTYSDIKKNAIESVLTKAIDSAIKVLDFLEEKLNQERPGLINNIKSFLEKLKQESNMAIAVSIVSILIGLLTGEAFDAVESVLNILGASEDILNAYEAISQISDTVDVKNVVDKTGQLTRITEVLT